MARFSAHLLRELTIYLKLIEMRLFIAVYCLPPLGVFYYCILILFVVYLNPTQAQQIASDQKYVRQSLAQDILDAQKRYEAYNQLVLDPHQVIMAPFSLQVAASEDELRAIKITRELRAQGLDAFYYPNFIGKKIIYKVCLERFKTEEEAYQALKKINKSDVHVISLASRPGSDKVATQSMIKMAELDKDKNSINMLRQPTSIKD